MNDGDIRNSQTRNLRSQKKSRPIVLTGEWRTYAIIPTY